MRTIFTDTRVSLLLLMGFIMVWVFLLAASALHFLPGVVIVFITWILIAALPFFLIGAYEVVKKQASPAWKMSVGLFISCLVCAAIPVVCSRLLGEPLAALSDYDKDSLRMLLWLSVDEILR